MKKGISIWVGLTFIILSFCACSVEKRLHNKGYHIDWVQRPVHHKQNIAEAKNIIAKEERKLKRFDVLSVPKKIKKLQAKLITVSMQKETAQIRKIINKVNRVPIALTDTTKEEAYFDPTERIVKEDTQKNHPLSWLSFITIFGSLASLLFFNSTPAVILLPFLAAIPSVLIGGIALLQIITKREKYKGEGLAIISILLSDSIILVGGFGVLLYWLLLSIFDSGITFGFEAIWFLAAVAVNLFVFFVILRGITIAAERSRLKEKRKSNSNL